MKLVSFVHVMRMVRSSRMNQERRSLGPQRMELPNVSTEGSIEEAIHWSC